jgi:hypothetical protein
MASGDRRARPLLGVGVTHRAIFAVCAICGKFFKLSAGDYRETEKLMLQR